MNDFDDLLSKLQEHDSHWQESAKLDFAIGLSALMDHRSMSKADLARKIHKSPAYVTKVLRGDTNFTIDTMVTLVRALDGALHLKVCDRNHKARFMSWVDNTSRAQRHEWVPVPEGHGARVELPGAVNESIRIAA